MLSYYYASVDSDGLVIAISPFSSQEEAPTESDWIYLGTDENGNNYYVYFQKRYIFETSTWVDAVFYHYADLGEFGVVRGTSWLFEDTAATATKILLPDGRDSKYYPNQDIIGRQYDVINSTPTNPIFRYFNPAAEYGSYAGNGATSRAFDLGFSPSAVFICRNDGATKDGSTMTGGLAVPNHPVTDGTTVAIEITATGFTVHRGGNANLNMSAKTYNYVVIR